MGVLWEGVVDEQLYATTFMKRATIGWQGKKRDDACVGVQMARAWPAAVWQWATLNRLPADVHLLAADSSAHSGPPH